jgi:hypothetical protein
MRGADFGAKDDVVLNKGELVLDADRDAPNKDELEPAVVKAEVLVNEAIPNKAKLEAAKSNRDEAEGFSRTGTERKLQRTKTLLFRTRKEWS